MLSDTIKERRKKRGHRIVLCILSGLLVFSGLICFTDPSLIRQADAANKTPVMKGIDVSEWQGSIDWQKVKNDGVEYAILRCGYSTVSDGKWKTNADKCTSLSIPFGCYLYSHATSTSEAVKEANFVLQQVKNYDLDFPIYYDLEDRSVKKLGTARIGAIAKAFCDTITDAGYEAGIYASLYWWNNYLTDSRIQNSDWSRWVAQYYSVCEYTSDYSMWQYSSKGSVKGISGRCDMDYWYDKARTADADSTKSGTVNTSTTGLNVRSGPSTSYKILGVLSKGAKVTIVSSSSGWYKIKYDGGTGYVNSKYIKINTSSTTKASSSSSSGTDKTGTVNTSSTALNVRSGPSTGYKIIGSLNKGAKVTIISSDDGWYKIKYDGSTGYVSSQYIKTSSSSSAKSSSSSSSSSGSYKTGTVNTSSTGLNVRSGPSTGYKIIGSLDKGDKVTIISSDDGWCKIKYDGGTGYVSSQYIKTSSSSSSSVSGKTGTVSTSSTGLNVRSGPSTGYKIIGSLDKGDKVTIISSGSGWYKIKYDGSTGYVCDDYIKL